MKTNEGVVKNTNPGKKSKAGSRVWVMAVAGLFGAAFASFLCAVLIGSFGPAFYGSLALGAAAGIILGAVLYGMFGVKKSLSEEAVMKAIAMLALAGIFFTAGTIFMLTEKDVKAPAISFTDEIVTMREGDPADVLFSNMTAEDDKDGNVRDQITVASFEYLEGGAARVTYDLSDSSGNKTTAVQLIYVEGEPWPVK